MADGKWVVYYRVSTKRQGKSRLGLDAQIAAVDGFLNGGSWKLACKPFEEVETGKRDDNRPELQKAMAACRIHGATLLIAKLDRLSRDAHFLLGLEKAGIEFVCADMPGANRFTVGIMAMVAEQEGRAISARTKAALAEAKRKGKKLGGYRAASKLTQKVRSAGSASNANKAKQRATDLAPTIADIKASGATSLGALAKALNERGIPTARGRAWTATQVWRVIGRAAE